MNQLDQLISGSGSGSGVGVVPQGGRQDLGGLQTGLGLQDTTLGLHMNSESRHRVPPLTVVSSEELNVRMIFFLQG